MEQETLVRHRKQQMKLQTLEMVEMELLTLQAQELAVMAVQELLSLNTHLAERLQ
jgi:hypothetical protein